MQIRSDRDLHYADMNSIELERTEINRKNNINIAHYKIDFRKKENELFEKKVSFIFKNMNISICYFVDFK